MLTEEYNMVMTTELEGKIRSMCNWSEGILDMGIQQGLEQGLEQGRKQGVKKERLDAIERMLNAGATREQILSFGYTEEELAEVDDPRSLLK